MNGLHLFLTLAVLGYSIYSVIVYAGRRHGNKSALSDLKARTDTLRTLTPEERSALQPVLIDPLKPGQAAALLHDRVLPLEGAFVRHGLESAQGGQSLHNTLGGVDVVLPYDAMDYLTEHNRAEVVLTDKFAIVIRLNDGFDLPGGHAREQQRRKQRQQWTDGRPGEVTDIEPPEAPAAEAAQANPFAVQLLGQRDETPAEAAARSGPGVGVLAALCFGLGFVGLALAGSSEGAGAQLAWGAAAGAVVVLALWLAWKPASAPQLKKVNRVRGRLAVVSAQMANTAVTSQLFLGDKFPLQLPAHWGDHARVEGDAEVDVEMRVDDYSVVRYGRTLSIDDEVQRYAPVHWGRSLTLALTGALALGAALLMYDEWQADAAQAAALLRHQPARRLADAQDIGTAPLRAGDMVEIHGDARCEIGTPSGDRLPAVDCSRLRFNAPARPLEALPLEPALQAFHDGSFVEARSDPRLDAMLQMQLMMRRQRAGGYDSPLAGYYLSQQRVRVISHVDRLVTSVQAACEVAPAGACMRLQQRIASDLKLGDEDSDAAWSDLVALRDAGRLTGEANVGVTGATQVSAWQQMAHEVADAVLASRGIERLGPLLDTTPAGLVVALDAPLVAPEPPARARNALGQWNAYRQLLGEQGAQASTVSGLVTAAARDARGDWVVSVDRSRTLDNATPALLRLAIVLLAGYLLLVHGALFVVRLRQARQRAAAVDAYCRARAQGLPAGL